MPISGDHVKPTVLQNVDSTCAKQFFLPNEPLQNPIKGSIGFTVSCMGQSCQRPKALDSKSNSGP